MKLPVYLLWCFRCLTGWGGMDRMERSYLVLNPTEYLESEDYRFGILDYFFIVPALIKFLLSLMEIYSNEFDSDTNFLVTALKAVGNMLLMAALLPCLLLTYLTAFWVTVVMSPFLIVQRLDALKTCNRQIEAIKALDIYVCDRIENLGEEALLGLWNADRLIKTSIHQSIERIDHTILFRPFYFLDCDNQPSMFLYCSVLKGFIIPHKGTFEGIQSILQLQLLDDNIEPPLKLNLLKHLMTRGEPKSTKQKKQFEAFFSITQAFQEATAIKPQCVPQDGFIAKVGKVGKTPGNLFNQFIAPMAGLSPISETDLKRYQALNDYFQSQNVFSSANEKPSGDCLKSTHPMLFFKDPFILDNPRSNTAPESHDCRIVRHEALYN